VAGQKEKLHRAMIATLESRRPHSSQFFTAILAVVLLWAACLWTTLGHGLSGASGERVGQFLSHQVDVVYVMLCLAVLLARPLHAGEKIGARLIRLALAAALNFAVVESIKHLFWLPRPGENNIVGRHAGFPSGHTVPAFLLAWLVSGIYPRAAPLCFGIATLIAWSRVQVHAHYTYQVVLSALLGCAIGWIVGHLIGKGPTTEVAN
jgi:membrane-associated phospholipid phosphatase